MNIGTTIKRIRREQNITQEQLSEYLNVTAQAVSRWETGTALPDISLVPVLANVFKVTADELLGIDIAANEALIDDIIDDAWVNYGAKGLGDEAISVLRNALKQYPNSYKLMQGITNNIIYSYPAKPCETNEEKTVFEKAMKEVISLGEKVLAECTDDEVRHSVIQDICYAYSNIGEAAKALPLAEKMPNKFSSREYLLSHLYEGTQLYRHNQSELLSNIDKILCSISRFNVALDDGSRPYTLDERITLQQKVLRIYPIMFEDENYGFYHERIAGVHRILAILHMEKSDTAAVLSHLRQAMKHALEFDKNFNIESEYTCLLFRGYRYSSISTNTTYNESYGLLKNITDGTFDSISNDKAFVAIVQELQRYAKIT